MGRAGAGQRWPPVERIQPLPGLTVVAPFVQFCVDMLSVQSSTCKSAFGNPQWTWNHPLDCLAQPQPEPDEPNEPTFIWPSWVSCAKEAPVRRAGLSTRCV